MGLTEAHGVVICRKPDLPGFVGVRFSMRVAAVSLATGDFPLLVSCRFIPRDRVTGDVACLVKSHTVVLWDRDERLACRDLSAPLLGASLLRADYCIR